MTMFGGCQKWEKGKSDKAQQKLAKTTVVQFGKRSTCAIVTFSVLIFLFLEY